VSRPLLLPLALPGLGGFCSTRQGGASSGAFDSLNLGTNTGDDPARVLANRREALQAGGLAPDRAVFLQQVHGTRILEAGQADAGRGLEAFDAGLPACDAAFTRVRGLGLAIGQADCLALVLADREAGLLGVAHAGWRGAVEDLAGSLARRLLAEGAAAPRLQAFLSPCLGPRSLELGQEQHDAFRLRHPAFKHYSSALQGGHFHLDLWTCVRYQLAAVGMDARQIQGLELDTAALPQLFFSHRRDLGWTGRMLTLAWLE
jgi:YfiH family protein